MGRIILAVGLVLLAVLILMGGVPSALGQEQAGFDQEDEITGQKDKYGSDLEQVLGGFDDQAGQEITLPDEFKKPDWLDLSLNFSLVGAVNLTGTDPLPGQPDREGLSQLKNEVDLGADLRLSPMWKAKFTGTAFYDLVFIIRDRDRFTDEVLDHYEKEVELGETYIQGSLLSNLDIKFGRQIIVWGKSDNIRVTDVLNPMDNCRPGLTDIENLRLPVTMTRLDYYLGPWNMSGIIIHEIRFNKDPITGSDFFTPPLPLPPEEKPSSNLDNQEYALALNGIFSGWDLSLYGAYFFDDQDHQEQTATGLKRRHSRLSMAGVGLDSLWGNWLFKIETAYLYGLEFLSLPGEKKSRLDMLLGVEYSGFSNTPISLEVVCRHLFDFGFCLKCSPEDAQENDFQTVFRISRSLLHDRLHLNFVGGTLDLPEYSGAASRLDFKYDLTDSVSLTTGLLCYQLVFFKLAYTF